MPQLRQMPNGQTRIRFHFPEERMARRVADMLRYVAAKRDGDDMLTSGALQMADDLLALVDALAKPKRPAKAKTESPPEPAKKTRKKK